MRKLIRCISAILVGLALTGAVQYAQLVKPVGFVTKDYCTRSEKPCAEYTFNNVEQYNGISKR